MDNKSVELILFQCQGLGLQINESLDRLSSLVEDKELQAETAYLLNDKGEILCTILRDKEIYESKNNQDRRVQNAKNGFNIVWVHSGDGCCVYKEQEKGDSNFSIWKIGVGCILLFILGIILGAMFGGTKISRSQDDINKINNLEIKCESLNAYIDSLTETINDYKEKEEKLKVLEAKKREEESQINMRIRAEKETKIQIEKLHSKNCTISTVEAVENWLKKQDYFVDKKNYYDLREYIRAYKMFFDASSISDLKILHDKYSKCFSNEQNRIIMEYCRSSSNFERLKKSFGMSFSKPIEKGMFNER